MNEDSGPPNGNSVVYKISSLTAKMKVKGKVFPLQARCGPEVRYRYSSTFP